MNDDVRAPLIPAAVQGHDRRAMAANTEPNIHDIVLSVLRRAVSCFSDDDTLTVQGARRNTRIIYSPARASAPPADLTRMELRRGHNSQELWIGSLHVAVPFRSMGIGRELVKAAEEIARATGAVIVNVFPLHRSRPFWLKMGYTPLLSTSRVLSRHVSPESGAPELPVGTGGTVLTS